MSDRLAESSINKDNLPQHVAVIMDGNGRWAKAQGKPRVFGHKAGVKSVQQTVSTAAKLGIKALTLFAFSSENWRRPEDEVSVLMELFMTVLNREVKKLHKNNIKFRVIGEKSAFSQRLQDKIKQAEALTENNTGMVLNIAANYGGKWDILQAAKKVAVQVESGSLKSSDIDADLFSEQLEMADLPEVDLLIRTSDERRISNFILWQMAYAEMYFTPEFWPDFGEQGFLKAMAWFVDRERRFGCTGEQIASLMQE